MQLTIKFNNIPVHAIIIINYFICISITINFRIIVTSEKIEIEINSILNFKR